MFGTFAIDKQYEDKLHDIHKRIDDKERGLREILQVSSFEDDFSYMIDSVGDRLGAGFLEKLKNWGKEWTIHADPAFTREAKSEHFPIVSGYAALNLLRPDELNQLMERGFKSIHDLAGIIGAMMANTSKNTGYTWTRGGTTTEVSETFHGDLRIFQADTTAHRVTDPIGNEVSYRPLDYVDISMVAGGHGVEARLLATIIKYVDQLEIRSELLKDSARDLIMEVKSQQWYGGNFGDFGYSLDGPESQFLFWAEPFQNLEGFNGRPIDFLAGYMGPNYALLLDGDKLAFLELNKDKQKVKARICPEDADDFMKALFELSMTGRGRSSVKQLVDTLEYRYSDKFQEDQEEFREMRSRR